MASKHNSRKDKKAVVKIKHRTTSPTLSLILPPPSMTQDDVNYGNFIKHLSEPFVGCVRGIKVAPPGIISGHVVLESPGNKRSKVRAGPLDCFKRLFRRLKWWFWKTMNALLRKDYLKDPADSVLNKRIVTEWSDDEMDM